MRENVLLPMGMLNSSYTQPQQESQNRATGYLWGGKEVPGKFHIYPEEAAAGLRITPSRTKPTIRFSLQCIFIPRHLATMCFRLGNCHQLLSHWLWFAIGRIVQRAATSSAKIRF